MKFTAEQIANIVNGTVEGDPSIEVSQLAKIEEGAMGSITFLANLKYAPYIYDTRASVVIVNNDLKLEKEVHPTLIRVNDAYLAFSQLLSFYNEQIAQKAGVAETAIIDKGVSVHNSIAIGHYSIVGKGVKLGKNVVLYPHVILEDNVCIGDNTIIHSHTIVHRDTQIGSQCEIFSGCVIGADGFGYAPNEAGEYSKIPQTGNVIIEDHVDIGANSTIDRATLGSTKIGFGVKLDNQIQIAHNVEIGAHTVIAAQSGVAGSSKVGKHCIIGGQVGIIGHLKVGDHVRIQGQSGVTSNIKDNTALYGTPAFDFNQYSKSYVYFKRFPALVKRLEALEKEHNESPTNHH